MVDLENVKGGTGQFLAASGQWGVRVSPSHVWCRFVGLKKLFVDTYTNKITGLVNVLQRLELLLSA